MTKIKSSKILAVENDGHMVKGRKNKKNVGE